MFIYAAEFSWWGDSEKVTNSHPILSLAANIIRNCQDQVGLNQLETLDSSQSFWAIALCNMVQEMQKGRWQNLETKYLTVAASFDEDKCACQNSFTNVLRCSTADKQNFYKVRHDRKPFNVMRINPFYLMELYIPSSLLIDHRKKCSNTQGLSIRKLIILSLDLLFSSLPSYLNSCMWSESILIACLM